MTQVTVAFHASVDLPPFAKGLAGSAVAVEASWDVRQLASAIERHCAAAGFVGLRVCALVNPSRGCAVPPHEQAIAHFKNGDRVVVLGDARLEPWPAGKGVQQRVKGAPVPITIFTGFLGAGKTTLLNHLLQVQRDKKFAVIENEFGEVPIDNELLQNSAMDLAEQVVTMENGCMCCTIRGDLLGAFDAIRRQMEQKGSDLDAVLVETTGMADPVPIVRTLRQTPDIAKHFRLDGTITLVDAKTILARLGECEEGKEDQERHRQIAFADKIILNKIDLVSDGEVAEVFQRIRSFNDNCPVIATVKGVVPPAELTGLGAFDMERIALEEEEGGHGGHGHGHGHDHGDGHECHEDHGGGHGGHGSGHDSIEDHVGHGGGHGHGHRSKRHDAQIGSFGLVFQCSEVEPLAFARWVRVIATLPPEQGMLYRSKGVLAAVGRSAKLVFHAVADITETSDGPEWGEHEQRICKIVFIGKKLDQNTIKARFRQLIRPVQESLRPALRPPSSSARRRSAFIESSSSGRLHRALLACWTKDVLRVSQTCSTLRDAIFSPASLQHFQRAASTLPPDAPRGLHTVEGDLWLHALLPLVSVKTYMLAWRDAKIKMNTPCSGDYIYGEPLRFDDVADVEAAGVMWLEVGELKGSEDTVNFVIEFKWRPETMQSFFSVAGSATNSSLVKVTVEDPDGDSELDDDLKFRVNLNPEEKEDAGLQIMHRMSLQLVGGKSSSRIYQIFFHTVDPTYQVHINVPDHRTPIFPTKEVFHQWHPLMNGLKRRPRLRFLLRLKPLESGPLDAMCGCCG